MEPLPAVPVRSVQPHTVLVARVALTALYNAGRWRLAPLYSCGVLVALRRLARTKGALWLLIFLVAAAITLVPTPLLEPRYFTPGVVIAVLNSPKVEWCVLLCPFLEAWIVSILGFHVFTDRFAWTNTCCFFLPDKAVNGSRLLPQCRDCGGSDSGQCGGSVHICVPAVQVGRRLRGAFHVLMHKISHASLFSSCCYICFLLTNSSIYTHKTIIFMWSLLEETRPHRAKSEYTHSTFFHLSTPVTSLLCSI